MAYRDPLGNALRSRRKREVGAHTASARELEKEVRHHLTLAPEEERPRTRGDCADGERPCPWVGCHHHLYLDVTETGSIRYNFPDLEPDELEETCALDVADRGGEACERAGELMNVSRERVRQLEKELTARLKDRPEFAPWAPDHGDAATHQEVAGASLPDLPDDDEELEEFEALGVMRARVRRELAELAELEAEETVVGDQVGGQAPRVCRGEKGFGQNGQNRER